MNQRYRKLIMWALYAALFLAALLVQSVVLGRIRIYGVKLDLLPVVMVCVGLWTGHESGGLFALISALVWALTGAEDAALAIVTFTVCAVLSGYLCSAVFSRRFPPAFLLSLGALLLHEGLLFLLKLYLEGASWTLFRWVPVTAGLSVLSCLVLYPLAKIIGKVGSN